MKILSLQDVHIMNLKYHQEQKQVFDRIYEHAAKEKPDYITILGDVFHTKGTISPEAYQIAADFFKTLAGFAPVHIILGNHDLILSNKNRLDTVTPVVEALNHPNIFLHKKSKEIQLDDKFTFNVMAIDDKENWSKPTDPSKVNIALFHGSIAGATINGTFKLQHGDIEVETLTGNDFVLMGDIHEHQQVECPEWYEEKEIDDEQLPKWLEQGWEIA